MTNAADTSPAGRILEAIGGPQNVGSLTHCATRLRFVLRDPSRADESAVRSIPGVLAVVRAGGQFQVVVGEGVARLYQDVLALAGRSEAGSSKPGESDEASPKNSLFNLQASAH